MTAAIRYLMPAKSDYVFLGVHLLADRDGWRLQAEVLAEWNIF